MSLNGLVDLNVRAVYIQVHFGQDEHFEQSCIRKTCIQLLRIYQKIIIFYSQFLSSKITILHFFFKFKFIRNNGYISTDSYTFGVFWCCEENFDRIPYTKIVGSLLLYPMDSIIICAFSARSDNLPRIFRRILYQRNSDCNWFLFCCILLEYGNNFQANG